MIKKSDECIKWVESLYKLFKKQFLKKSEIDKDFYFSATAINWVHENNAAMDTAGLKMLAYNQYRNRHHQLH